MIANSHEARDEARRLTKVHKRNVEVKAVECCDFDKSHECGGAGFQYQLVFTCGHDAEEENGDCERSDCVHLEYLESVRREQELEMV